MPAALDLLSRGIALIDAQFGTTAFVIEGLGGVNGNWNDLGRTETLELNGRRVAFSVVAEFPRSAFPIATTAQLLELAGKKVTKSEDGKVFRIVGQVAVDELTVRFPLNTTHQ